MKNFPLRPDHITWSNTIKWFIVKGSLPKYKYEWGYNGCLIIYLWHAMSKYLCFRDLSRHLSKVQNSEVQSFKVLLIFVLFFLVFFIKLVSIFLS